jgi:hypothetical protein
VTLIVGVTVGVTLIVGVTVGVTVIVGVTVGVTVIVGVTVGVTDGVGIKSLHKTILEYVHPLTSIIVTLISGAISNNAGTVIVLAETIVDTNVLLLP